MLFAYLSDSVVRPCTSRASPLLRRGWGWAAGGGEEHRIAVFPVYWLGLGMRAALLPPDAASVEIAGSWRSPQSAAVLCARALAGLIVAPLVLKRMARRESGSRVAQQRERALQRAG